RTGRQHALRPVGGDLCCYVVTAANARRGSDSALDGDAHAPRCPRADFYAPGRLARLPPRNSYRRPGATHPCAQAGEIVSLAHGHAWHYLMGASPARTHRWWITVLPILIVSRELPGQR